jgi:hypothetical protein
VCGGGGEKEEKEEKEEKKVETEEERKERVRVCEGGRRIKKRKNNIKNYLETLILMTMQYNREQCNRLAVLTCISWP